MQESVFNTLMNHQSPHKTNPLPGLMLPSPSKSSPGKTSPCKPSPNKPGPKFKLRACYVNASDSEDDHPVCTGAMSSDGKNGESDGEGDGKNDGGQETPSALTPTHSPREADQAGPGNPDDGDGPDQSSDVQGGQPVMLELCDACDEQEEPRQRECKNEEGKKLEEDGKAVPMLELCDKIDPLEQEESKDGKQALEEEVAGATPPAGSGAATKSGKRVAMKRPAANGAATEGHGKATKRPRDQYSSGNSSSSSGAMEKLRSQSPSQEGDWQCFRNFGNDDGKAQDGEGEECKGKRDAGEDNFKGEASNAGGGNGKCEGKFHGKANDAAVEQVTSLSFKTSSFEPPPHLAGQVVAEILEFLLAQQTSFLCKALLFFGCEQVGQVSSAGTLESTLGAGRSLVHGMSFKDGKASSVHLKLETRKVGSHQSITVSCKLRSCVVPVCQLGSQVIVPDEEGKFDQFMFLRIVFAWRCVILAAIIRKRTLKVPELVALCMAVKEHLAPAIPFLLS